MKIQRSQSYSKSAKKKAQYNSSQNTNIAKDKEFETGENVPVLYPTSTTKKRFDDDRFQCWTKKKIKVFITN